VLPATESRLTHGNAAVCEFGQALIDLDPRLAIHLDQGKVKRMIL
jgi:hypothetical protein